MAAVDLAGYIGSATATIPGFGATLDGWSATISMTTAVFSIFGSPWKSSKLGIGQMTGSVTGTLKFNAANNAPFPDDGASPRIIDLQNFVGSTVLTAFTGCTLTATCNYTNVTIGRPDPGGKSEFSADFKSDGAVALAWDETS